jgi:hypothetical protein
MGNISLFFHLMSLIVFIALCWWIVHLSAALKAWRDWHSPVAERRIIVGEPIRVMRAFARAVGAGFESEIASKSIQPKRLKLEECFALHRLGFIERVIVKNGSPPCVCFVLRHKPGTIGVDPNSIIEDLGGALVVEFSASELISKSQS